LGRGVLEREENDHAITVTTCLVANCWRVTEVLAFPSETGNVISQKGLVAASKIIRQKVFFSPYHSFVVLLTCCGEYSLETIVF
jgi:hypothetical protein